MSFLLSECLRLFFRLYREDYAVTAGNTQSTLGGVVTNPLFIEPQSIFQTMEKVSKVEVTGV